MNDWEEWRKRVRDICAGDMTRWWQKTSETRRKKYEYKHIVHNSLSSWYKIIFVDMPLKSVNRKEEAPSENRSQTVTNVSINQSNKIIYFCTSTNKKSFSIDYMYNIYFLIFIFFQIWFTKQMWTDHTVRFGCCNKTKCWTALMEICLLPVDWNLP